MFVCNFCNNEYISYRSFWNHIKIHNISIKDYYDKFIKKPNEGICHCGNITKYYSWGYNTYCSISCAGKINQLGKKASNKSKIKVSNTLKEKYKNGWKPFEGKTHSEETKEKMSSAHVDLYVERKFLQLKNTKCCTKHGFYWSEKNQKDIHYRSSYELKAYNILEKNNDVVKYEIEVFKIPYVDKNKQKRYTVPDLLVFYKDNSKMIIEVKSDYYLSRTDMNKIDAVKKFSKDNNLKFSLWTEKILFSD